MVRCIAAVCAAVVTSVAPPAAFAQAAHDPAPPVSQADLSWSLQTLDGKSITLASFAGRVMIVNSWATWCEPCVAELQSFARLRAALPDTGLVFVMVAPQAPEPVAAFVRRRGVSLPVYLERTPAPVGYRFETLPMTWIIDRRGQIVLRHRGARRWDTPEVRESLAALLMEPARP